MHGNARLHTPADHTFVAAEGGANNRTAAGGVYSVGFADLLNLLLIAGVGVAFAAWVWR
jgi:hypothetical protein